jgi:hypothetical protein
LHNGNAAAQWSITSLSHPNPVPLMNLYTAAKWRTARLTRFDYRKTLVACIVLALTSDLIRFIPNAHWMARATLRDLEGLLLVLAVLPLIPMLWSRFHISRHRVSLQLYVEHNDLISFHWTPRPEWATRFFARFCDTEGGGLPSVPRRAALTQLREWTTIAQSYGFKELRLDSPLFVTRDGAGRVVLRGWLKRFVEPLERMDVVDRIEYAAPAPLSAARAMSYRLFWPEAARRACQAPNGRILAGGIIVHLIRRLDA